jgi:hypothetical protein
LPWFLVPESNVTISRDGGKYAAFADNVELIREMIRCREQERQSVASSSS